MKKIVVTKRFDNQALFDFMMRELGGEAVVMKRFYGTRIAQMAGEGMRLSDLLEEAEHNGWREQLEGLKMKDLADVILPAEEKTQSGSKRLTKEEIEKVRDDVLVFLGDNPWKRKNDIAEAIGFSRKKLGAQLKALKDEGKLKTVGEKAAMKYALASEPSKPRN